MTAPQRPTFLRFACLLAVLGGVHVVDRDARDDARDASAYVWPVFRGDAGWSVIEARWSRRTGWDVSRTVISEVTREQAMRCAENLAASIRAMWAEAEGEREGSSTGSAS